MKFIATLFVIVSFLSGCSEPEQPSKLYIADWSSLSTFEQDQIQSALDLLTEGSGEEFLSFSGNRPLILKSADLQGTNSGKSTPQTYKCEIIIDSNSDLIRNDPELLQYIFIHELGHCYGLDYSSDPDSVMYPTFNGSWNQTVIDKLKEFSKTLRVLSK